MKYNKSQKDVVHDSIKVIQLIIIGKSAPQFDGGAGAAVN